MGNYQILIVMIIYMALVIGIGLYFAKRANENSENYFLGGRSLGPWIAAMSAEASDMSGWLLMGLPGLAYFYGFSDAAWTAIGLLVGTYINWLIVAKRLHAYSIIANDSVTIPEFFSNRFKENKKVIMTIAALFIMVFFTVYASSCFAAVGKLFTTLFGIPYQYMMIAGAIFVIIYTFLGGFLAESASDFMQAIVMIVALVGILFASIAYAGGVSAVYDNLQQIPGFLDFFGISTPVTVDEVQQLSESGVPLFGEASIYGFLTILSTLSWGLGYFGMPQVLLRFMAIRSHKEIKKSRRIATVWCAISLFAAVFIGLIGRAIFPVEHLTYTDSEKIFITMATNLLPIVLAGLAMAGILAATISSSDSYLLIASSAVSKNIYQGLFKKNASDQQVMRMSRIVLMAISFIGILFALNENSVIFKVVAFAWAGFGATFGPIMLFSLFWKRTTREGAIGGMLSGGIMVFLWKLVIRPMGGIFGIYELLPAFVLSCLVIIIVSLVTEKPSKELQDEFEQAKVYRD
jgi:sodium/proline symporter